MAWHTEFTVALALFVAYLVRYACTAFICPNCAAPISGKHWMTTTFSSWSCESCGTLVRFSSMRRSLRVFPLALIITVSLINQAIPIVVPSIMPKNIFVAFGIVAVILPFLVTDKLEVSSQARNDAPARR